MQRRNVLFALYGAIAGYFLPKPAVASPVIEPIGVEPAAQPPEELILTVHGGALPMQYNACIHPVASLRGCTPRPGSITYDIAPTTPKDPLSYPFSSGMMVCTEIAIGTVDQLVECYRQQLTRAVESLRQCTWRDFDAEQAYLRACYANTPHHKHGVAFVAWDTDPLTGRTGLCEAAANCRDRIAAAIAVDDDEEARRVLLVYNEAVLAGTVGQPPVNV